MTLMRKDKLMKKLASKLASDDKVYEAVLTVRWVSKEAFEAAHLSFNEWSRKFSPDTRLDGYLKFEVLSRLP